MDRAEGLRDRYGVEVLTFSWPAHGGGLRGSLNYKSDKRDAKASIGALDRTLALMYNYLDAFSLTLVEEAHEKALKKHPTDHEEREEYMSDLIAEGCPFTINMMLHSMGNYVYKHLLLSGASEGNQLLFDNVALVAADTNNADHASWVDRIKVRRGVYIVINERDGALQLSRMKPGDAQRVRLGHFRRNLEATQARYVDLTDAPGVGDSHSYFEGRPVRNANSTVRRFFYKVFNGIPGEEDLEFAPATRMYRVRRR